MILNYKTGKLPFNFIALGILLFALSMWRMIVLDWKGILFFLISLIFIFLRSGILIDTGKRRIKKYIGFLVIKKGEWEDIRSLKNLEIINKREAQNMSVLSINRTETVIVYKLLLSLPDNNIEIMSGKRDHIINRAQEISALLQTKVINKTPNHQV